MALPVFFSAIQSALLSSERTNQSKYLKLFLQSISETISITLNRDNNQFLKFKMLKALGGKLFLTIICTVVDTHNFHLIV